MLYLQPILSASHLSFWGGDLSISSIFIMRSLTKLWYFDYDEIKGINQIIRWIYEDSDMNDIASSYCCNNSPIQFGSSLILPFWIWIVRWSHGHSPKLTDFIHKSKVHSVLYFGAFCTEKISFCCHKFPIIILIQLLTF